MGTLKGEVVKFEKFKISLVVVRTFGLGFMILDPYWNDFCVHIHIFFFEIRLWSKGDKWLGFSSFWNESEYRRVTKRK